MNIEHTKRYGERNILRGHLPPPFYNAQEDNPGRQYLSEAGLREPNDMTKRGYGNAMNKPTELSGASRPEAATHHYDPDYRHYGDRRWHDDAESAWEKEYYSRRGYRSIGERVEIANDHRGKGPRSYQRTDQRILEDLNERLTEDPFLDASEIETSVSSGEIVMSGWVRDRQSRRRAEDVAETISGVRGVQNRLRVK